MRSTFFVRIPEIKNEIIYSNCVLKLNPLYLQEDHAGVLAAKEKEVVAKDKELGCLP